MKIFLTLVLTLSSTLATAAPRADSAKSEETSLDKARAKSEKAAEKSRASADKAQKRAARAARKAARAQRLHECLVKAHDAEECDS